MLPERHRSRRVRRIASAVLAAVACALLLIVLDTRHGSIPGLGPALDPGHGDWASASDVLPRSQTPRLPGPHRPVQLAFTCQGLASIRAAAGPDMFLALGHVHGRLRLTEMDLKRRLRL